MRCQAITKLNDGSVGPCAQEEHEHGLCYYHFKMMQGYIKPRLPREFVQSGSPVLLVEKGEQIIHDGRKE